MMARNENMLWVRFLSGLVHTNTRMRTKTEIA
jgi:hypothetical protein